MICITLLVSAVRDEQHRMGAKLNPYPSPNVTRGWNLVEEKDRKRARQSGHLWVKGQERTFAFTGKRREDYVCVGR